MGYWSQTVFGRSRLPYLSKCDSRKHRNLAVNNSGIGLTVEGRSNYDFYDLYSCEQSVIPKA